MPLRHRNRPQQNLNSSSISFEKLPNDILLHILQMADSARTICRAAATCKRWNTVAMDQGVWFQLCRLHQGNLTAKSRKMLSRSGDGVDWKQMYFKHAREYTRFLRLRKSWLHSLRFWILFIALVWFFMMRSFYLILSQHSALSQAKSIVQHLASNADISNYSLLNLGGLEKFYKNAWTDSVTVVPGVIISNQITEIRTEDSEGEVRTSYQLNIRYSYKLEEEILYSENIYAIDPWTTEEASYDDVQNAMRNLPTFGKIAVFLKRKWNAWNRPFIALDVSHSPYVISMLCATLSALFLMIATTTRSKKSVKPLGLYADVDYRVHVVPHGTWMYEFLDDRSLSARSKWILNLFAFLTFQIFCNVTWGHFLWLRSASLEGTTLYEQSIPLFSDALFSMFMFICEVIGNFPIIFVLRYVKHALHLSSVGIYSPRRGFLCKNEQQKVFICHRFRRSLNVQSVHFELKLFEIMEEAYMNHNEERRTRIVEICRYSTSQELLNSRAFFDRGDYITGELDILIPGDRRSSLHEPNPLPQFVWYMFVRTQALEIPVHIHEVCILVKEKE